MNSYDRKSLDSTSNSRFKHDGYLWYGPWPIGFTRGLRGFEDSHQRPFLHAFPDRVGGDHKARFGEGRYVCCTGWPSIRATHAGDYLGQAATRKHTTLRVMDWFTREGSHFTENRVWFDIPDFFRQIGTDLFTPAAQFHRQP